MTRPISTYHVCKFNSMEEAQDALLRVTQLLTTASGKPYLVDDPAKRAVILSGSPTTVYLSRGALEVAILLWIKLPTSTVIKSDELPNDLSLIFGETGDLPRTFPAA